MAVMDIEFLRPERLWLLLIVPVIGALFVILANRRSLRPGLAPKTRLDRVIPRDAAWKRYLSVGLALLSLVSLIVAYAMPKDYGYEPRDRATVVVTIDVSISMRATDVEPSRWEAAQVAAKEFVRSLPPRFNVAVVAFAGTAQVVAPPTVDRGAVLRAIDALDLEPATAIGEGVYASLRALDLVPPDPDHPDEVPPAAIVLLSDGSTNVGRDSTGAAQVAKKEGVPIYTIAYGTESGYVMDQGRRQRVPVNHAEMASIARESGGKKFAAESSTQLGEVYEAIAEAVGYERVYVEVTDRYAGFALLFAVLAALGVISLGARWP
ncbi:MAG: VWA domain-containing protein [Propionibacteriaceae bacterium]|nr:VWA domain-containing protein [Propionibacteriaceae bacterium]